MTHSGFDILYDPDERRAFIDTLMRMDGLKHDGERRDTGYGIIALTGLGKDVSDSNERVKAYISSRQGILRACMGAAGIELYDPANAPYSPDTNLKSRPNEVFSVDSLRVSMARHVSFADVIATTGGGIEQEKARRMGKFCYIFHDPNIRTSRMQIDRALHLSAANFGKMRNQFIEMFEFMQEYEPCIGLYQGAPAMIGMHQQTGTAANLEIEVAKRWPELIYEYEGTKDILMLSCMNPHLFVEEQGVNLKVEHFLLTGMNMEDGSQRQEHQEYAMVVSCLDEDPVDAILVDVVTGEPIYSFNIFENDLGISANYIKDAKDLRTIFDIVSKGEWTKDENTKILSIADRGGLGSSLQQIRVAQDLIHSDNDHFVVQTPKPFLRDIDRPMAKIEFDGISGVFTHLNQRPSPQDEEMRSVEASKFSRRPLPSLQA